MGAARGCMRREQGMRNIGAAAAAFTAEALSSKRALAAVLDHTLLKPEATRLQVIQLCAEASECRFACAMVNPCWVPLAVDALRGTGVPVGVVIGFPLGASLTASKVDEAREVLRLGAHDVDMVMNIGFLKSGLIDGVRDEIQAVAHAVHGTGGGILKVILETALLTREEKLRASEIAVLAGADFIKTSTGFSTGGATIDDVAMIRSVAGERCGVKASGGIRSLADIKAMLSAGSTRIGASASVRIVQELGGVGVASDGSPGY